MPGSLWLFIWLRANRPQGEWAGLCTYDKEGQAHKVVGASCVVVHQNVAKEADPAVSWLLNYVKSGEGAK
jgi:hypothetical protein